MGQVEEDLVRLHFGWDNVVSAELSGEARERQQWHILFATEEAALAAFGEGPEFHHSRGLYYGKEQLIGDAVTALGMFHFVDKPQLRALLNARREFSKSRKPGRVAQEAGDTRRLAAGLPLHPPQPPPKQLTKEEKKQRKKEKYGKKHPHKKAAGRGPRDQGHKEPAAGSASSGFALPAQSLAQGLGSFSGASFDARPLHSARPTAQTFSSAAGQSFDSPVTAFTDTAQTGTGGSALSRASPSPILPNFSHPSDQPSSQNSSQQKPPSRYAPQGPSAGPKESSSAPGQPHWSQAAGYAQSRYQAPQASEAAFARPPQSFQPHPQAYPSAPPFGPAHWAQPTSPASFPPPHLGLPPQLGHNSQLSHHGGPSRYHPYPNHGHDSRYASPQGEPSRYAPQASQPHSTFLNHASPF